MTTFQLIQRLPIFLLFFSSAFLPRYALALGPDVKAEIFYQISVGPDTAVETRSPTELFESYQTYLQKDCPDFCATLSNLKPTASAGTFNGKPLSYEWDYEIFRNGVFYYGGTTGSISAVSRCASAKPLGYLLPYDAAAVPRNATILCTDGVPQQDPEKSCGKVGNPILVGSGIKTQDEVDYAGPEADGLSMIRFYSSNRRSWLHNYDQFGLNLSPLSGAGGGGACLQDVTAGENPQSACFEYVSTSTDLIDFSVIRPSGLVATFTGSANALQKLPFYNDQLYPISVAGPNSIPTGWYLLRSSDNAYEEYDTYKRLTKISLPNGRETKLSYANGGSSVIPAGAPICSVNSASVPVGKLACVTGPNGRQLNFAYNADGKLASFTNPEGGVTSYEYDGPSAIVLPPTYGPAALSGGATTGSGNANAALLSRFQAGMITKVTYPDGTSKTYYYNEQVHTNNVRRPFALTGIVDESGTRFATYKYSAGGTALSTEHAGGVNKYSVEGYQVTDPLGATRSYGFENKLGRLRLANVSQPGGAGCAAATSSSRSDENLNVTSRADFNGSLTYYEYDLTRNLETLRTEAAGNADERKFTTAWHPHIRIPSKIAQAKRLSYFVYNGQPDPDNGNAILSCVPTATAQLPTAKPVAVLCKVVETGTSDETGALGFAALPIGPKRVSTFTYNAAGNVLTTASNRAAGIANTALTYYSASDTAAVPLYRKGDLQRISNALGHTTLFQEYDPSGRIKKMTDPNGLVTAIEYSPRGWLTKVTTSGGAQPQVLSMEYFPTGKLKKATQPDGSWVQFEYDPAQRLVGMFDNVSNSVRYSLDGMGNRITEENRDSTGALSKMVVRVFDALGRVQQVQGAAQ